MLGCVRVKHQGSTAKPMNIAGPIAVRIGVVVFELSSYLPCFEQLKSTNPTRLISAGGINCALSGSPLVQFTPQLVRGHILRRTHSNDFGPDYRFAPSGNSASMAARKKPVPPARTLRLPLRFDFHEAFPRIR